jgi:hypothetical protein
VVGIEDIDPLLLGVQLLLGAGLERDGTMSPDGGAVHLSGVMVVVIVMNPQDGGEEGESGENVRDHCDLFLMKREKRL